MTTIILPNGETCGTSLRTPESVQASLLAKGWSVTREGERLYVAPPQALTAHLRAHGLTPEPAA